MSPITSLLLVEKQKSLSVSCIILPPRLVVGQKGRVTISIEGRRADQVQTAWFLNDVHITDTSYTGNPNIKEYLICDFVYVCEYVTQGKHQSSQILSHTQTRVFIFSLEL